jgi:parallel beta-helix repeat protein
MGWRAGFKVSRENLGEDRSRVAIQAMAPRLVKGSDLSGAGGQSLTIQLRVEPASVVVDSTAQLTATSSGPLLQSWWAFGDGTSLPNQTAATHTWSRPGVYLVLFTGYDSNHPEGVTATLVVTVGRVIRYVNGANRTPVFPYASWATAATNIQEAIGAGSAPTLILVSNGVYRVGATEFHGMNRVVLTNPVVLQSVSGPAATVIEGSANGVRCAYVGNGAVLSGFTLTLGTAAGDAPSSTSSGGGVWAESLGVVTNCVLTGNSAGESGGGAVGGILYNCRIESNVAVDSGGGANSSTLHNCLVTGNSSSYGGGTSGCTLHNCTVVGNTASGSGGGVYLGNFDNSIVYYNHAPEGANAVQATAEFSCTTPLAAGHGNIEMDPQFANIDNQDFQLRFDSPCLDAGDNSRVLALTDLLGTERVLDGDGDGAPRVDMGASEWNPYRLAIRTRNTEGALTFTLQGEPNQSIRLERSADAQHWEPVDTLPLPGSGLLTRDLPSSLDPLLFYRLVKVP